MKASEEGSGGGCGCEAKSKLSYCFPGDAREAQKLLRALSLGDRGAPREGEETADGVITDTWKN